MTSDLEKAGFVVLGWLLGLVGQRVVDTIRNAYDRKAIRKALAVEVNDLRARLAMTAAQMLQATGGYDIAFVRWLRPILREYSGFYSTQDFIAALDQVENWGDEKLKATLDLWGSQRGDTGFEIKRYRAPFLDEKVAHLTLFSPEFQQLALAISAKLAILNEESDVAWFYFTKTFDAGMDVENQKKLRFNANRAYRNIGQIARDTADLMSWLLALKG